MSTRFTRSAVLTFFCLFGAILSGAEVAGAQGSPKEIFEQRIMPIFKSPNPSSCTECHLAGVDLKNYILVEGK